MEGRQIFNLVKHEQPQTISFLLSYLDSAKSAEVFALLGPDLREEVLERLGTIESTSLELVGKIAKSLGKHYDTKMRPAFHCSGGVRAVADLMNELDKDMSKNLLARLEERNATLSAGDSQETLHVRGPHTACNRPISSACSVKSIRRTSCDFDEVRQRAELRDQILRASISRRAAESLKEEIEMLGPVRLKDVEAAQD